MNGIKNCKNVGLQLVDFLKEKRQQIPLPEPTHTNNLPRCPCCTKPRPTRQRRRNRRRAQNPAGKSRGDVKKRPHQTRGEGASHNPSIDNNHEKNPDDYLDLHRANYRKNHCQRSGGSHQTRPQNSAAPGSHPRVRSQSQAAFARTQRPTADDD